MLSRLLWASLAAAAGGSAWAHDCVHEEVQAKVNVARASVAYAADEDDDGAGGGRRRAFGDGFGSIRITYDTSLLTSDEEMCTSVSATCGAEDVMTTAKRNFLVQTLLPAAEARLSGVLSVDRVVGSLTLSSQFGTDCYEAPVPASYFSSGVAATDFVVFVTARPTSGSTLAWAAMCQTDDKGRPIAAQVNFGPSHIETAENFEYQLSTAVHELLHALGFSSNSYGDFMDKDGVKWSQVTRDSVTAQGKPVTELVTPGVVAAARAHFDCDTMDGLELEDAGGSGSAGSHWDKRQVENEIMIASASQAGVFSAMTMGLLDDTGWYLVDYSTAEKLPWGNNEGCTFATGRCNQWVSDSPGYFCDQAGYEACTFDRSAVGYCSLATYTSALPSYFQYFADPTKGGDISYLDYCPIIRPYGNGRCDDADNAGSSPTFYGSTYGEDSICFMRTLLADNYVFDNTNPAEPSCYMHECRTSTLALRVNSAFHECPVAGGQMSVTGYNGYILCPAFADVCDAPEPPGAPATPLCTHDDSVASQFVLSWSAPADQGSSAVTEYVVFDGDSEIAQVAALSHTLAVGDAPEGKTFQVAAVNSAGRGPRSVASTLCVVPEEELAVPLTPEPPVCTSAPDGVGSRIVWSNPGVPSGAPAITGYVLRLLDTDGYVQVYSGDETSVVLTMYSPADGGIYTVAAVNDGGSATSDASEPCTVTVAPSPTPTPESTPTPTPSPAGSPTPEPTPTPTPEPTCPIAPANNMLCNGHGTCNIQTLECACETFYSGPACTVYSPLSDVTEISFGELASGSVDTGVSLFFAVPIVRSTHDIVLVLSATDESSDADLDMYMSFSATHPSPDEHTWSSTKVGNENYRISRDDTRFELGPLFVTVVGHQGGAFALIVVEEIPPEGEETEIQCPNDCSKRGSCDSSVGECDCDAPYAGVACQIDDSETTKIDVVDIISLNSDSAPRSITAGEIFPGDVEIYATELRSAATLEITLTVSSPDVGIYMNAEADGHPDANQHTFYGIAVAADGNGDEDGDEAVVVDDDTDENAEYTFRLVVRPSTPGFAVGGYYIAVHYDAAAARARQETVEQVVDSFELFVAVLDISRDDLAQWELCGAENGCSGNGKCVADEACDCDDDYSGRYCETKTGDDTPFYKQTMFIVGAVGAVVGIALIATVVGVVKKKKKKNQSPGRQYEMQDASASATRA